MTNYNEPVFKEAVKKEENEIDSLKTRYKAIIKKEIISSLVKKELKIERC